MGLAFHAILLPEVLSAPVHLPTDKQGMTTFSIDQHSENPTSASLFRAGASSVSSRPKHLPRKFSPRRSGSAVDPIHSRKLYRTTKALRLRSTSKPFSLPASSRSAQPVMISQNEDKLTHLTTRNPITHIAVGPTTLNFSRSDTLFPLFCSRQFPPHFAPHTIVVPNTSNMSPLGKLTLIPLPIQTQKTSYSRSKVSLAPTTAWTGRSLLPILIRSTQPSDSLTVALEAVEVARHDYQENRDFFSTVASIAITATSYSLISRDSVSATDKVNQFYNSLLRAARSNHQVAVQANVTLARPQLHGLEIRGFTPVIISNEQVEEPPYSNTLSVTAYVLPLESEDLLQSPGHSNSSTVLCEKGSTEFFCKGHTMSEASALSTTAFLLLIFPFSEGVGHMKKIEFSTRFRLSMTFEHSALRSKRLCSDSKLEILLPCFSISQQSASNPEAPKNPVSVPWNIFECCEMRERKHHPQSTSVWTILPTKSSTSDNQSCLSLHSCFTTMHLTSSRVLRAPNLSGGNGSNSYSSILPHVYSRQNPQCGKNSASSWTEDSVWNAPMAKRIASTAWELERNRSLDVKGFRQLHIDSTQAATQANSSTANPCEMVGTRDSFGSTPSTQKEDHSSRAFSSPTMNLLSKQRHTLKNLQCFSSLSPHFQENIPCSTFLAAWSNESSDVSDYLRTCPQSNDSLSVCAHGVNEGCPSSPFFVRTTNPIRNEPVMLHQKQTETSKSATSQTKPSPNLNLPSIHRFLKPPLRSQNQVPSSRRISHTLGSSTEFNFLDNSSLKNPTPLSANLVGPGTSNVMNGLDKPFENHKAGPSSFQAEQAESVFFEQGTSRTFRQRSSGFVDRRRYRPGLYSTNSHFGRAVPSDAEKGSKLRPKSGTFSPSSSDRPRSRTFTSLYRKDGTAVQKLISIQKSKADSLQHTPYNSGHQELRVPTETEANSSTALSQSTPDTTMRTASERKVKAFEISQGPFDSARAFSTRSDQGLTQRKLVSPIGFNCLKTKALQNFSFCETPKDSKLLRTGFQPTKTVLPPAAGIAFETCPSVVHSKANIAKSGSGTNRMHHPRGSQLSLNSSQSHTLCSSLSNAQSWIPSNPFENQYFFLTEPKGIFPKIGDRIKVFKNNPRVTRRAKVVRQVDNTHFLLSYSDYTLDRKTELQVEIHGVFHSETVCLKSLRWSPDNGLPKRRRGARGGNR